MPYIYQNVRGLRTKLDTISLSLLASDADIVGLTETWLDMDVPSASLGQHNYQLFRRDRNYGRLGTTRGGGCALLVRNGIRVTRIEEFESDTDYVEDIWVRISLKDTTLYLCLLYMSPVNASAMRREMYVNYFSRIRQISQELEVSSKVLIVGDFNLSRIEWQPTNAGLGPIFLDDSITSQEFHCTLSFCDLTQHNSITNPNDTILDLVLSDMDGIAVSRSDISLVPEDAHHPTLVIEIDAHIEYMKPKKCRRFNFRRADYDSINEEIACMDWTFIRAMPLERSVDIFYERIDGFIARHVPVFVGGKKVVYCRGH